MKSYVFKTEITLKWFIETAGETVSMLNFNRFGEPCLNICP